MKVTVRKRFIKDAALIKSAQLFDEIINLLEVASRTEKAADIPGFKVLKGYKNYGRIRLDQYRIGVVIQSNSIIFVCILSRK